MEHRGTQDALRRVTLHCNRVDGLNLTQQNSIQNKRDLHPKLDCCGGVQVCLDLSRAFDQADRSKLFQALRKLGAGDDLCTLLQCWHHGTRYILNSGGFESACLTCKGVRQGCTAAPALWSALIGDLLERLIDATSWDWVLQSLTVYADDFHASQLVRSAMDLRQFTFNLGILLDLLQDSDLLVNAAKSVVLLRLTGADSATVFQQHTKMHNGSRHLIIPRLDGAETLLPIHDQTCYLGMVISYQNMSQLSVAHRLRQAQCAFGRLKRWLKPTDSFSLQSRYQLWRRCIIPVLTYGLGATGYTSKGIYKIQIMITQQLRYIAGDLAFLTRNTHEHFYNHLHSPTPLELMQTAINSQQASLTKRQSLLPEYDIVLQQTWESLFDASALVHQAQMSNSHVAVMPSDNVMVPCTLCDKWFLTTVALTQHMLKIHRTRSQPFAAVDYTIDAVGDIPQCRHCGVILGSWKQFRVHVSRHHTKLAEATTSTAMTDEQKLARWAATEQGRRILPIIQASNLPELSTQPDDCAWLSNHCILCGVFLDGLGGMTHHLKHVHGDLAPKIFQLSATLWRDLTIGLPCLMCKKSYWSTHYCPVMYQVAICHLLDPHLAAVQPDAPLEVFFVQPRDSLAGKPVCAHCHIELASMPRLRDHILKKKCVRFDPLRTDTPAPIDLEVLRHMYSGTGLEVLQDREVRARLTLCCQQCGAAFTGPSQFFSTCSHVMVFFGPRPQIGAAFSVPLCSPRQFNAFAIQAQLESW